MSVGSNFESTSAWNDSLVIQGVLDSSETISNSILSLSDGVIVRSLDEDGAREGVLNAFNEGVLVISKRNLIDKLGESEIGLLHVFN